MKENFKEKTCCFTGHPVIPTRALPRLVEELEQTLRRLIGEGVRYFGAGVRWDSTPWPLGRCCG